MATVFRTTAIGAAAPPRMLPAPSKSSRVMAVSFRQRSYRPGHGGYLRLSRGSALQFGNFVALAASGDTETTEVETEEPQVEDSVVDAAVTEDVAADSEDDAPAATEESPDSAFLAVLKSYREAIASNNESMAAEIEDYLKSIDDEKTSLETKVAALSAELSIERDRVLRISADFDNFRKRTDRERLSLVSNAQGEVVENFLPVLDNFERAKTQIKVETEGEEKINNSYQSIYKQFTEVLGSLGVVPVETVSNPFDPLLHEAIMREESTEYEEGIVLQEFRKGFKLGDRLLRPSMVKVSAGPGPTKQAEKDPPSGESEETPAGEGVEETTESS